MSYQDGWRASVEDRFRSFREALEKLVARVARLEAMLSQLRAGRGGGGGSVSGLRWARTPSGGVGAASSAWPNTGVSFESDVYRSGGSSLVLVAEDATVYWRYPDAVPGGRLVPCIPNADGSFDAITISCGLVGEES